ncbi:MAG: PTS system mannose/fructose/sorbose family transporter subunit IID [Elusimicrobiota bacterium]
MQSLGFLYAIFPKLKKLYGDEKDLKEACLRHLHFFNTHPYMAMFVLGYSVRAEEKIKQGKESPESLNTFKRQIGGPLAALGDKLFWSTWRPLVGLLGVFGVICSLRPDYDFPKYWAYFVPLGFIVIYNLFHLYFRARALYSSYTKRTGIANVLKEIKENLFIRTLPFMGMGIIAAILMVAVYNWGWLKGGSLMGSTGIVILLRRKYKNISATKLLYLVSAVVIVTYLIIRTII